MEQKDLISLATMPMPFGKYTGRVLIDLPEAYLLWFEKKGFPTGNLGRLLGIALEIKRSGLEKIIDPLREPNRIPRK